MLTNYEHDWNIDGLTDTQIYDAIQYLDPDRRKTPDPDSDDQDQDNGAVICVCLYIALLGCLAFVWFYWR